MPMNSFLFDFWSVWGLVAQALFFSRFVFQWYISEKRGKIVIPQVFWYISLLGAVMVLIYAFVRKDIVFLITGILQIALYSRSLYLSQKTSSSS
jgi:lipid-A-disaccharide synthase-like uncharacterized protein